LTAPWRLVEKLKNSENPENYKILVIGSPGSGKTTFAKKLAESLNIPLYHLDDFHWQANWIRRSPAEMQAHLQHIGSKSRWIIDGNHFKTLPLRAMYAKQVIFLDIPVVICLWRFLTRSAKRFFGKTEDLPEQIKLDKNYKPKISIEWHLIKLILLFQFVTKPKALSILRSHNLDIIHLTSKTDVNNYLKKIIQT
jgi:adenylate kinase family enzyme